MLRKFGGPDGFAVVERPVPEPGAERVALGAVADAHARIERGGLEGKIVLIPDG
jgi:NADPH:quinone reductase-like Zn-dependent oxidoreductase